MRAWWILPCAIAIACGHRPPSGDGDGGATGADGSTNPLADAAYPTPPNDQLETATGCSGVFNPDQLLDYHLEMAPGDWQSVLGDLTYSVYYEAQFRCGDGGALRVAVRRKRSGGTNKVGLKIDFNELVAGQSYQGLRKLSLENGVSSGGAADDASAETLLSEYLGWRAMQRGGALSSRAAFARLFVNGSLVGLYINVEQVDKRFLRTRLGHDDGWLYKKSGGAGDGFKTHETDGLDDPYDDYFCFWDQSGGCSQPSSAELAAELPGRLNIAVMLRMGAINAMIANTDSPIFKDNNYYWYDFAGGRLYLPWDLDTTFKSGFSVFTGMGIGGRTGKYIDVLFTHWRPDYETILAELIDTKLTSAVIDEELSRAVTVAGSAFDEDPYVSGSAAGAADALRAFWTARLASVSAELGQ